MNGRKYWQFCPVHSRVITNPCIEIWSSHHWQLLDLMNLFTVEWNFVNKLFLPTYWIKYQTSRCEKRGLWPSQWEAGVCKSRQVTVYKGMCHRQGVMFECIYQQYWSMCNQCGRQQGRRKQGKLVLEREEKGWRLCEEEEAAAARRGMQREVFARGWTSLYWLLHAGRVGCLPAWPPALCMSPCMAALIPGVPHRKC